MLKKNKKYDIIENKRLQNKLINQSINQSIKYINNYLNKEINKRKGWKAKRVITVSLLPRSHLR